MPAPIEERARDDNAAEQAALDAYLAYRRKDYVAALALYMKSQNASPSPDVLFAIAHLYDTDLGDPELALRFYRAFLAEATSDIEHVTIAQERSSALRASMEAAVEPPPALPASVELPEAADPPRSVPALTLPSPRRRLSGLQITGIVLGALGVASLGSGAFFGVRARTENNQIADECMNKVCSQRGLDTAARARDFATASTATIATGGVLAVLGVSLAIWGKRSLRVSPLAQAPLGTSLTASW